MAVTTQLVCFPKVLDERESEFEAHILTLGNAVLSLSLSLMICEPSVGVQPPSTKIFVSC